ncbi:MAG: sulfatase-like hydrolase/transferase, partial [Verrucomicrobiota bacterium]
ADSSAVAAIVGSMCQMVVEEAKAGNAQVIADAARIVGLDMAPYCYLVDRRVEALPSDWHEQIPNTIFLNGVSGVKQPGFEVHDVIGRFGDETVKVIESHVDREEPLFLYLPLTSPHLPVAPANFAEGKSKAGLYGDFTWETDHFVGRVLGALDAAGMSDNTFVLFTSDNGGLWHWWDFSADDDGGKIRTTPRGKYVQEFGHQSNADWRGTKADIYEGGHRVPFLVRWPARVEGGRVSDALVELTDVHATITEMVGARPREGTSGMDSISFLPILTGELKTTRPNSVHHSLRGMFAIREGNWKLIEGRGSGGFTAPRHIEPKDGEPEGQLYDLSSDPQERVNLWEKEPEIVRSLLQNLNGIRTGRE